ncbi:hypothetical protein PP753_gp66 [Dinoroseobacter phage vB_DshP-R7L]|uniref:DNA recombination-mediator protein A n=1 Tax=Dinoroseobacter phage vB_DshP-R7L TaxID=2873349 RepID=A0AAE8XBI0_9CAUD|nr:hypothetical protein PP753_gp66 [Dinoroseobacter phage vB_DshP-R7L]UAT28892.1 hypothetical protein R7L_gp53 [Dinoroseobacter phage vB_DshP-R7L]
MEIYYAGIGSRETPEDVCRKMFAAGRAMAGLGFILRSGGAQGADESFESGVDDWTANHDTDGLLKEIYLPWKGFRKNQSDLYGSDKAARLMAKEYHPNWPIVSCAGRDFHARNCYQILGRGLDTPSAFVLCWTPGGAVTGGTGQALRIAKDHDIPILNFAVEDDDTISDFIFTTAERMRA